MKVSDFSYNLPEHLIAKQPAATRSGSRLMTVHCGSGSIDHKRFADLPDLLRPGDLLVFNDTRVIPARLYGRKASGGQVEVLLERVLADEREGQGQAEQRALAQVRASKKPKIGSELLFHMPAASASKETTAETAEIPVKVVARQGEFFVLQFPAEPPMPEVLQAIGHTPLPPYIDRPDTAQDAARYQTVYAEKDGAVAAPTAGLHFDEALLEALARRGVGQTFVTLHVGAGTFQPLRVPQVEQHQMHREWMEVDEKVCQQIARCKNAGGRVVAVGTTAVRVLETAALKAAAAKPDSSERNTTGSSPASSLATHLAPHLAPYRGDTDIFIYPGFQFRVVDAMVTNFHLPESTLLMLVSAFAGRDLIRRAYQQAIAQEYRFFSYGDAMLLS